MFLRELAYHTYHLNDSLTSFDSNVFKKIPDLMPRLNTQMISNIFDPTDPIPILSFLPKF